MPGDRNRKPNKGTERANAVTGLDTASDKSISNIDPLGRMLHILRKKTSQQNKRTETLQEIM